MQRVFCVRFSGDGSYVFSGSDDMNVRVWKAEASEQLGVTLPREKHKAAYNKALVNRYKHMPEIKRIVRHRHVPTAIKKVSDRICPGMQEGPSWRAAVGVVNLLALCACCARYCS